MISVIVPIYNAAKTLNKCVDSLLAQSFEDFEIILIDDGSTDASAEICDSYADRDERVRVIHQPNGGASAARNAGIEIAHGDWMAFCDSDDTVETNWLSSLFAASHLAGMVVCGYNHYLPGHHDSDAPLNVSAGRTEVFTEIDVVLETMIEKGLFRYIWNKLFRSSVIMRHAVRFKESLHVFEDEYFVLEYMSHIHDMVCIPDCTYNYFMPEDYHTRYDYSLDDFQEVVEMLYRTVAGVPGRVRIPSVVYWYMISLGYYASSHTYEESVDRLRYARKLAVNFHDGPFDLFAVRFFSGKYIYRRLHKEMKQYWDKVLNVN